MTSQESRDLTIETLVAAAEKYGNLYDAFGKEEHLELAVAYEKEAFALRETRPTA